MQKKSATLNATDWHRADVVAALKKVGWSVRSLSVAHGLHPDTLAAALTKPYPKGERIIADALGLMPEQIWPCRYARRRFRPALVLPKAVNA
jgi:Ner family transcriptional regulator